MPVTIGELTTEVVAEGGAPAAGTTPAPVDTGISLSGIRGDLAALARLAMRTRAEGFDD